MALIQALLAERFHLRLHRETRELPIYSVVVGKSGPRLQPTTAATGPTWSKTPGLLTGQNISMEMFATESRWTLPIHGHSGTARTQTGIDERSGRNPCH